jgi:DNA-binding SARP family transcriptional activator
METASLKIGLLGPVQLGTGLPRRRLASAAQRALIAALALADGRVVSYERLIYAVWEEESSSRRLRNLQFHISKLRGQLRGIEPGRPESRIVTQPSGYQLDLAGVLADWQEFPREASRARVLRRAGDLAGASDRYQRALSLWRGPALDDVATMSSLLGAHAARLDEERLNVIEEQADVDLAAGRHHEIHADLAWLTEQHGLRQRLISSLMIALYRSGRQADALAAYARYRRELASQFGLDPDAELDTLHRRILASDPGLALSQAPPAAAARHTSALRVPRRPGQCRRGLRRPPAG